MLLRNAGRFGLAKRFSWPVRLLAERRAFHSTVGAVVLAFIVSVAIGYAKSRGVLLSGVVVEAPICAALLHVGMDALLSMGLNCFGRWLQRVWRLIGCRV